MDDETKKELIADALHVETRTDARGKVQFQCPKCGEWVYRLYHTFANFQGSCWDCYIEWVKENDET